MNILYIDTGNYDCINSPVHFISEEELPEHSLIASGEKCFPIQFIEKVFLSGRKNEAFAYCVRPGFLKRESVHEFDIISDAGRYNSFADIKTEVTEKGAEIKSGGINFCTYFTGTEFAKPYLGPFKSEYGDVITRHNYSGKEHPHHRSLWISHGDINGADTWNEPEDCGFILNDNIFNIKNGTVFTQFEAHNTWTRHDKSKICGDITTIRMFGGGLDCQIIDISLVLSALPDAEVTLGRTKEAGPVAVRMAGEFTVQNGGIIKNSRGGVNEKEIWMKKAEWNDYCGTGKSGKPSGIALFDYPANDSYPSAWHTRDYGLMAVNNFYLGGEKIIPKDQCMVFNYRIVVHSGMTEDANIAGLYNNYINQPSVVIK